MAFRKSPVRFYRSMVPYRGQIGLFAAGDVTISDFVGLSFR